MPPYRIEDELQLLRGLKSLIESPRVPTVAISNAVGETNTFSWLNVFAADRHIGPSFVFEGGTDLVIYSVLNLDEFIVSYFS